MEKMKLTSRLKAVDTAEDSRLSMDPITPLRLWLSHLPTVSRACLQSTEPSAREAP